MSSAWSRSPAAARTVTAGPLLAEPALVVNVFAPLDGPGADAAYADLRRLWSALRDRLGWDRPIDRSRLAEELPADRRSLPASGRVAGLANPGDVVVMAASSPAGRTTTNMLKIHRVGSPVR